MTHIFISYSHTDSKYAHRLAKALETVGLSVWIDDRIDYGTHWLNEIEAQINECHALILIMTPSSKESDWVQNEWLYAHGKKKPIFPFLLEGELWLPFYNTQYVDVLGGQLPPADFYTRLKEKIAQPLVVLPQDVSTWLKTDDFNEKITQPGTTITHPHDSGVQEMGPLPAIAGVQEIKRQAETMLMNMTNVVATGVGFKSAGNQMTTEPAIIVSVVKKLRHARLAESAVVPRTINGVKTDVIETGRIVAFRQQQGKMQPARPGVSIGHYLITAGTFGCLVQKNGQVFILSNNHVLANSNAAQVGDPIWQPGKYDGGTSMDQIGTLEQFIPIGFPGDTTPSPRLGSAPLAALMKVINPSASAPQPQINEPGNNTVDCAIARPASPELVTPDILNIGVPIGVGTATLGTQLQKMGRTTAYTTGQITQIDVTVSVDYGGKIAVYTNQLMAGAMSAGGDSGSAVLDMQKRVVGLLYAGSDTTTILNPIQFVLDALQVQLVTA